MWDSESNWNELNLIQNNEHYLEIHLFKWSGWMLLLLIYPSMIRRVSIIQWNNNINNKGNECFRRILETNALHEKRIFNHEPWATKSTLREASSEISLLFLGQCSWQQFILFGSTIATHTCALVVPRTIAIHHSKYTQTTRTLQSNNIDWAMIDAYGGFIAFSFLYMNRCMPTFPTQFNRIKAWPSFLSINYTGACKNGRDSIYISVELICCCIIWSDDENYQEWWTAVQVGHHSCYCCCLLWLRFSSLKFHKWFAC